MRGTVERLSCRCEHRVIPHVAQNEEYARYRVDGKEIYADDRSTASRHCGLTPAPGSRAEIQNPFPVSQQPKSLIDFDELVRRSRAQSFFLGAQDIGIVPLPLKPARR